MSDFEKELMADIREIRSKVESNDEKIGGVRDDLAKIDKKLAVHKVKSGLLGTVGGAGIAGLRELVDTLKASLGGGA